MRFRTRAVAVAATTLTTTLTTMALSVSLAGADSAVIVNEQPASQTVVPGANASFTATASGSPEPSLVWQMSTDNGATFKSTSVTSPTLTVTNATTSENGNEFRAVFTNASGSVITNAAVLSVAQGAGNLVVTFEPQNVTVPPGQSAVFHAAATGDPQPTVEWEVSTNKGGSWATTGVTSTTLTLGNVPMSLDGNEYRAVFSNSSGVLATAPATLVVSGAPPPGSAAVTLPAATAGEGYSVTLTATGGKAPYRWSLESGSNPVPAGLSLSPAGVLSGTPVAPGTTTMTVEVADSSNPPQLATETITLTVKPACAAGNVTFVCQAYVALLGRSPAPAEISLWVRALDAHLLTPQGVALVIATSQEYRTLLVEGFFKAYLHRGIDLPGLATNIGLLAGGATDETVQAGILGSHEYFAVRGGSTTAGFVGALYGDLLGRPAEPAGVAYWQQQIDRGVTTTQIAVSILDSPEYRGDLVASDFKRFLGRPVDGPGLNAWVSALAGGETDEQMAAGLVSSQEFMNHR